MRFMLIGAVCLFVLAGFAYLEESTPKKLPVDMSRPIPDMHSPEWYAEHFPSHIADCPFNGTFDYPVKGTSIVSIADICPENHEILPFLNQEGKIKYRVEILDENYKPVGTKPEFHYKGINGLGIYEHIGPQVPCSDDGICAFDTPENTRVCYHHRYAGEPRLVRMTVVE